MTDARATQAAFLVPTGASSGVRTTQTALLAATGAASGVRATQAALLALVPESVPVRATQAALLAATGASSGARLTQFSVLALATFVPCLTRWAQCWRIARADGEVFTFTSLDRALTFRGDTYQPCDSLSASASELAAVLGSVGNMELSGLISDDAITEADLFGGLFDGASVEVWMVPWSSAGGDEPWRLAKGTTGNLSQGEDGFSMEVLTPGARLQQQALLQTYTPQCRFDLGDARCKVDLPALTVTGTATLVAATQAANAASRRIFADSARMEAHGWFELGMLEWTSGANTGARSEVKEFDGATGTFTLWQPMLHPIEPGDAYKVSPGCDKLSTTCKDKFDNFVNNGGFPDVPGRDSVTQSPNSK